MERSCAMARGKDININNGSAIYSLCRNINVHSTRTVVTLHHVGIKKEWTHRHTGRGAV